MMTLQLSKTKLSNRDGDLASLLHKALIKPLIPGSVTKALGHDLTAHTTYHTLHARTT